MLSKTIGRVVPPAGKTTEQFIKELDDAITLVGPIIKALGKDDDTVEIVYLVGDGGMVEVLPKNLVVAHPTYVGKKVP